MLTSLTALVDADQRQKGTLADQPQGREKRVEVREQERQNSIIQNRVALKRAQDDIAARNLEKLRSTLSEDDADEGRREAKLNLRENPGGGLGASQANARPGQLVNILV